HPVARAHRRGVPRARGLPARGSPVREGMTRRPAFVVTCEHASRAVPSGMRRALAGARDLLPTHRGWDPGALPFAEALARALDAPLVAGKVSRLVIDLNRSPHNPRRFSPWTRALEPDARAR